jgi:hypothetical protein
MVERPIKKSERQAVTKSNDVVEEALDTEPRTIEGATDPTTQSPSEQNTKQRPLPVKDKTKGKEGKEGKGRGDRQKDDQSSRPPMNPALLRGPKPTKPKPPLITKTQEATESDSVDQATQEET